MKNRKIPQTEVCRSVNFFDVAKLMQSVPAKDVFQIVVSLPHLSPDQLGWYVYEALRNDRTDVAGALLGRTSYVNALRGERMSMLIRAAEQIRPSSKLLAEFIQIMKKFQNTSKG
jgi:hypothetical protein